jgi:hypothetical protein
LRRSGSTNRETNEHGRKQCKPVSALAAILGAAAFAGAAAAGETPKYGDTLTYLTLADAPPSFDAHRETTFATIHLAAPF